MTESYKRCPICETLSHHNASLCTTCGASLDNIETFPRRSENSPSQKQYEFQFGETDLFEQELSPVSRRYMIGISSILLLIISLCLIIFIAPLLFADRPAESPTIEIISTPLPTLNVVSVTPGPPTATASATSLPTFTPTDTATPAPCIQQVVAGNSLIGLVVNCGHQSLDVIPTVLAINDLADESRIRVGQTIIIPWPTPTIDPFSMPTETPAEASNRSDDTSLIDFSGEFDPFAPTATPTLLPGVIWHTILSEENIITIAVQYGANIKILSELNPEVDFAQCDFGENFGGPECIVQLFEGQQVRVPAPTPTPTIEPTLSGNETFTPTATATINAPSAISPEDLSFFNVDEIVTLRWVGSASLTPGSVYVVDIADTTSTLTYTAQTEQLFFQIPENWQGKDGSRHEFVWSISIATSNDPDIRYHTTEPRQFVWQSKEQSS